MKIHNIYNVWAAILIISTLSACYGLDDDYNTATGTKLSFSVDTLAFDTILTSVGSATKEFMVYNNNASPLLIKSIKLAGGDGTIFRINVDGRNGKEFSDIRIEAKDSLYIFAEATAKPTDVDNPVFVQDKIEFVVNNAAQYVPVTAFAQDVILLKGGTCITKDTTLSADRPYLIYDSLVVAPEVKVNVDAGAVFYMFDKAKWVVHGTLATRGTSAAPVVFRGNRLDKLYSDLPFDLIPGLWDGIYFSPESYDNELEYTIVKNAFRALVCEESNVERKKIRIDNCLITNMTQSVFEAVNCRVEATGSEFSNTSGTVVSLTGGISTFIHCSLVNFHVFIPARNDSPTLLLSNRTTDPEGEPKPVPLQQATFINSIVDGSLNEGNIPFNGEIKVNRMENVEFNFTFNHCAVKTFEVKDTNFVDVRFITRNYAPVYNLTGSTLSDRPFVFDYRPLVSRDEKGNPLSQQPVVGQADTTYSALYSHDRFGAPRLPDHTVSDIGAYAHIVEEE